MDFPAGVHRLTRVPKGNDVKGKVWREAEVTLPDDRIVHGRYESTRGAFVYFEVDGQHYRAFVDRFADEDGQGNGFVLKPKK